MKYLLLLTFQLIIAYCSNAQNSKPYYYYQRDSKNRIITDTTKGFITSKWALVDISFFEIYFDNGSRVNLLAIFNADSALLRNPYLYNMAALEYMDQHSFRLIGSTENLLTFQRK